MPTPSPFQRLKERKLVQWAVAYLHGSWAVHSGRGSKMKNGVLILGAALVSACATGQAGWRVDSHRVVVVGSDVTDQRLEAVQEAVGFWNETFSQLGLGPPFGRVQSVPMDVDEELLARYSQAVLQGGRRPRLPESLLELPGETLIVLSDSDIISFAASLGREGRWVVGIRTDRVPPLSLPNVPRNLVAHELGHTVGLGHNSDASKLMCGRPSPCRPGEFRSNEPHFFELTPDDLKRLSEIHGRIEED